MILAKASISQRMRSKPLRRSCKRCTWHKVHRVMHRQRLKRQRMRLPLRRPKMRPRRASSLLRKLRSHIFPICVLRIFPMTVLVSPTWMHLRTMIRLKTKQRVICWQLKQTLMHALRRRIVNLSKNSWLFMQRIRLQPRRNIIWRKSALISMEKQAKRSAKSWWKSTLRACNGSSITTTRDAHTGAGTIHSTMRPWYPISVRVLCESFLAPKQSSANSKSTSTVQP